MSSPFTLAVFVIVLIFLARSVWGIKDKAKDSNHRLSVAEAELSRLEAHKEDLADRIDYLSTEQGIEAELRTKYRAVRNGESVAVILDDKETASVGSIPAIVGNLDKEEPKSLFVRVLQFFGLGKSEP